MIGCLTETTICVVTKPLVYGISKYLRNSTMSFLKISGKYFSHFWTLCSFSALADSSRICYSNSYVSIAWFKKLKELSPPKPHNRLRSKFQEIFLRMLRFIRTKSFFPMCVCHSVHYT